MPEERPKYFTSNEVSIHTSQKDLWVSFLGNVYDLTPLCLNHQALFIPEKINASEYVPKLLVKQLGNSSDPLMKPILAHGGKDITHWFDKKTKDIRMYIDPVTNCRFPFTPMGRLLHTPPFCPRSDWSNNFGKPWWRNEIYCIGKLSQQVRKIRIINTLTSQEQTLEVCGEETMSEIKLRYLKYNKHAASYTWKYNQVNLNMQKTLEENNVKNEGEEFFNLGLDEDCFLPAIHLYFNDDLTEA